MTPILYGTQDVIPTQARLRCGYVHLVEGPKALDAFMLCTHDRHADGTPVEHELNTKFGKETKTVPIKLISADPAVNCRQALVSHCSQGRAMCRADGPGMPFSRQDGTTGECAGPAQCDYARANGCSTEIRLLFVMEVDGQELLTSFVTHSSAAADEIPRMIRMASITAAGKSNARAIQLTLRKLPRVTENGFESYSAPTITLGDCAMLTGDEIRELRQEGAGTRRLHAVPSPARSIVELRDNAQRPAANEIETMPLAPSIMARMPVTTPAPAPVAAAAPAPSPTQASSPCITMAGLVFQDPAVGQDGGCRGSTALPEANDARPGPSAPGQDTAGLPSFPTDMSFLDPA